MENRKCNKVILFRVTEQEWNDFDQLAKTIMKKPKALILRQLIKGFVYQPSPSEDVIKLLRILTRISNNINQIAYVANKTGNIDAPALAELYRQQIGIISETRDKLTTPISFDLNRIKL